MSLALSSSVMWLKDNNQVESVKSGRLCVLLNFTPYFLLCCLRCKFGSKWSFASAIQTEKIHVPDLRYYNSSLFITQFVIRITMSLLKQERIIPFQNLHLYWIFTVKTVLLWSVLSLNFIMRPELTSCHNIWGCSSFWFLHFQMKMSWFSASSSYF